MVTRVLSAGLLAGLVAGLLVAALQNFTTTPLILQAEIFERAGPEERASVAEDRIVQLVASDMPRFVLVHSGHDHGGADGWAPADGGERIFYTSTATVGAAIGFAFLLLGGMLFAGDAITGRTAVAWAAAAFVATGLAPAAGLPPELPGMAAADLMTRQAWWLMTAVLTAMSLWLLLRTEGMALKVVAVVLLLAPHILGAPHLHEGEASRIPAELAARFASLSLVVHAVLWIATGAALGMIWPVLAARDGAGEVGRA